MKNKLSSLLTQTFRHAGIQAEVTSDSSNVEKGVRIRIFVEF